MAFVNKQSLVKKIIARLTGELELYAKAAHAAHAEATHEQSKAENKYDTRGLEASYLARGQSKQAAELEAGDGLPGGKLDGHRPASDPDASRSPCHRDR